eukprot:gene36847-30830_t
MPPSAQPAWGVATAVQLCGTGPAILQTCDASATLVDTRLFVPCEDEDGCTALLVGAEGALCTHFMRGCTLIEVGAGAGNPDGVGTSTLDISGCVSVDASASSQPTAATRAPSAAPTTAPSVDWAARAEEEEKQKADGLSELLHTILDAESESAMQPLARAQLVETARVRFESGVADVLASASSCGESGGCGVVTFADSVVSRGAVSTLFAAPAACGEQCAVSTLFAAPAACGEQCAVSTLFAAPAACGEQCAVSTLFAAPAACGGQCAVSTLFAAPAACGGQCAVSTLFATPAACGEQCAVSTLFATPAACGEQCAVSTLFATPAACGGHGASVTLPSHVADDASLRVAVSVMDPQLFPSPDGPLGPSTFRQRFARDTVLSVQMAADGGRLSRAPGGEMQMRLPVPRAALRPWPCALVARAFDAASGSWGGGLPVRLPAAERHDDDDGSGGTAPRAENEWC